MLKKNLEHDIVPDKESNNVVIPGANIHLVKNAESKLNVEENNAELEQEITEKGKDKFQQKTKKQKGIKFK